MTLFGLSCDFVSLSRSLSNLKLLNELSEDDSCEEMTFNNDDNFNINDKVNFNENDHKIYSIQSNSSKPNQPTVKMLVI